MTQWGENYVSLDFVDLKVIFDTSKYIFYFSECIRFAVILEKNPVVEKLIILIGFVHCYVFFKLLSLHVYRDLIYLDDLPEYFTKVMVILTIIHSVQNHLVTGCNAPACA